MTRRQVLRNIFQAAVDKGLTVQDLLDRIEAFTAAGKSGIESFINETLASLTTPSAVEAAQARVNAAQAELNAAIAAVKAELASV